MERAACTLSGGGSARSMQADVVTQRALWGAEDSPLRKGLLAIRAAHPEPLHDP